MLICLQSCKEADYQKIDRFLGIHKPIPVDTLNNYEIQAEWSPLVKTEFDSAKVAKKAAEIKRKILGKKPITFKKIIQPPKRIVSNKEEIKAFQNARDQLIKIYLEDGKKIGKIRQKLAKDTTK